MSSNAMWKRDANGVDHPTDETLLASIREQSLAQEKDLIREHLLTGCPSCHHRRAMLTQDSNALNHLNHMSRYLYYPEVQSNQVWLHIQRGEPLTSVWTGKRKRKFQVQNRSAGSRQGSYQYAHKTGLRVFRLSFPVAFGLLLLLTTVVIVLAYTLAGLKFPFAVSGQQPANKFFTPVPGTSSFQQHLPTPTMTVPVTITPTPSVIATQSNSPTPTMTVIVAKSPAIDYCSPPNQENQIIFICGYDFNVGDKVSLVLDLYGKNAPLILGPISVDKHGEFIQQYIYSCKNPPLAIYAKDDTTTTAPMLSNTLSGFPVTSCYGPTPTATPVGHS